MFQVNIKKTALKELRELPTQALKKVTSKIDELIIEARPSGCKKLKGEKDLWRIRVGDYRIIYSIDDIIQIIEIRKIGHRREIYD